MPPYAPIDPLVDYAPPAESPALDPVFGSWVERARTAGPGTTAADWFATPGAPAPPAPTGLMQNPQGYFKQLIQGKPATPDVLVSLEPQLNQAGIEVMRNAAGVAGKIRLPNGQIVDVIRAAGAGGGGPENWQWLTGPGGGGGIGAGLETSPGFQFRLGEGLKALERSAAARGTLLTGGTLKGIQRYAQDYASGEYGQRVNQLMGLSQLGANAAAGVGGAASSYGQSAGDLLTQIGNAQAAGTIGGTNAWTGAMGNAANTATQMYLLSRLFGGGGGAGAGGGTSWYPPGTPGPAGTPPWFPPVTL
jgi:hypothetical protein